MYKIFLQAARDDALLNLDLPVREGELDLVDVEVGSKLFLSDLGLKSMWIRLLRCWRNGQLNRRS